jgi:hypothetical protein
MLEKPARTNSTLSQPHSAGLDSDAGLIPSHNMDAIMLLACNMTANYIT